MEAVSWEKIIYLCFTAGLYMLQIYQNINSCSRYYRNIQKINNGILDLRSYIVKSIHTIDSFLSKTTKCSSYRLFCSNAIRQRESLQLLLTDLNKIKPFENTFENFNQTGELMRCFYQLYDNPQYEECIRYSMGFNGYIDTLGGLNDNILNKDINPIKFSSSNKCSFKDIYHPSLKESNPIKNNISLSKSMIITGPNAAGKTTLLKSTIINLIFTQQTGFGFYRKGVLNPYKYIHSYINIPDSCSRDSLFQSEARRCKNILDIIEKTLIYIDIIDSSFDTEKQNHMLSVVTQYLMFKCHTRIQLYNMVCEMCVTV